MFVDDERHADHLAGGAALIGKGGVGCREQPPADETDQVQGEAGDSEDASFGEFIEDHTSDNPVHCANQSVLRQKIESLLKTLTWREREIIRLRYGLQDGYTYTLEEVGRILKVTRERVRQIEAKAVRKLQHPVRSRQLEGFLDGSQRR